MRSFRTAFTRPMLEDYQRGVMSYEYKGVRCLKSPVDIAIYMRLIWTLRPRTLIEIGAHSGGSTLLFADILGNMGCGDAPVISIDLRVPDCVEDNRIRFLEGNVLDLAPLFEAEALDDLPHPWFVVEDSAHSYAGCTATLELFAERMEPGDILAIEDGVLDELGMSDKYDGGPNRAISDYLTHHPDSFQVVTEFCDMFGTNATYNPNGYLRKF